MSSPVSASCSLLSSLLVVCNCCKGREAMAIVRSMTDWKSVANRLLPLKMTLLIPAP